MCVDVRIVDDDLFEHDEIFSVELNSNQNGPVVQFGLFAASVFILDNDGNAFAIHH